MSRILPCFALLAFGAGILSSHAATNTATISVGSISTLAIDGTLSDRVLNWEGGDLRGTVVTQSLASTGAVNKTVGGAAFAPLVMHVALPLSSQLTALVNELCNVQATRHTVVLTDYDSVGRATGAFELRDAMISELTFPAFDATAAIGPMRLVFKVGSSAAVAPSTLAGSLAATGRVGTFQFAIDGIDGRGVMRIEPFTVRRLYTDEPNYRVGTTQTPSGTEFPTLIVTISDSRAASWRSWWTSFVVNGSSGDEKRGSLALMDATGAPLTIRDPSGAAQTVALNFRQLGILRVSRPAGTSGTATKAEAELYFEGLSLGSPTPTLEPSGSTASAPLPGPIASVGDRTPAITEEPVLSTASPVRTASVATVLNPADTGTRDPAQFPRVDGLTRTYYSGTFQANYTQEQASYTSSEPIAQLVARVDAAANAAGWTLARLGEDRTSNGQTVGERWTKGTATAGLDFSELTGSAGTRLDLQVYVQLPTAN